MRAQIPAGPVALVTGSSSGFGLLTCLELARRGLRVFASMRSLSRSAELDRAMLKEGLRCDKIELEVSSQDSIARAVAEIESRGGPVDVLVNNAGFAMAGFTEDLTLAEYREQFETNFFGLVAVTKAVIPGMRRRRRGRIINISSTSGIRANPGLGAYAASKFAVEGFSEALRQELLPYDVYVSVIEPGMFRTAIFDRNRRMGTHALSESSPNYRTSLKLLRLFEQRLAISKADPRDVAEIIAQAATTRRPRLRYLVGTDARLLGAIRSTLPFGVWERAVARVLGRV